MNCEATFLNLSNGFSSSSNMTQFSQIFLGSSAVLVSLKFPNSFEMLLTLISMSLYNGLLSFK